MTVSHSMTSSYTGTPGTGINANEYGDGFQHTTVLTFDVEDMFTIADNAALADGYLIYTLPAGECIIESAYINVDLTAASTEAKTDTPDLGIGTVIASGAVATLDGTATFENILTGQTMNDCDGTNEVFSTIPTAAVPLKVTTAGAHTIHLNVADTWANDTGGDLTMDCSGTVVINWVSFAS